MPTPLRTGLYPDQPLPRTRAAWWRELKLVREHARRHGLTPFDSKLRRAWRKAVGRPYYLIQDAAQALLLLTAGYRDRHALGFDMGFIRARLIERFPVVTRVGPHLGNPTRMGFRDLGHIRAEMIEAGARVPPRPRRAQGLIEGRTPGEVRRQARKLERWREQRRQHGQQALGEPKPDVFSTCAHCGGSFRDGWATRSGGTRRARWCSNICRNRGGRADRGGSDRVRRTDAQQGNGHHAEIKQQSH